VAQQEKFFFFLLANKTVQPASQSVS